MACDTTNLINTMLVLSLKGKQLMYKMRFTEPGSEIDPDSLGFNYVDDTEYQTAGGAALRSLIKIICNFSIPIRIDLNGHEKSFSSLHVANEDDLEDSICMGL